MLSRVADCMFWMSRYLERAEHLGRLLNTSFHVELDLAGVMPADYPPPWKTNVAIVGQQPPEICTTGDDPEKAVAAWMTFDINNPVSILANVNRARNNARTIRAGLGPDVWRALNELYWQLRDADFEQRARESPFAYYQTVEAGSQRFQGVCDATLPHDEGWRFIQLGKYLERADTTIRTLDVKFRQLQRLTDQADLPLKTLEWGAALKACNAYEAYQSAYIGRVEAAQVVEFLLLHRTFPRSVRFCLEEIALSLNDISQQTGGYGSGKADRLVGRLLAQLRYAEPEELLRGDFPAFLHELAAQCGAIGRTIQEQYSLAN